MTPSSFVALVVSALLLSPAAAAGQTRATTADLAGVVTDGVGGVLAAASVTASHVDTGLTRTQVTNPDGRFSLLALSPGSYVVRVEFPGFAPLVREGLVLELGSRVDLDLTMSLATQAEEVVVSGETPAVDLERTAIATFISRTQIDLLPTNGRNFVAFSLLAGGVTTDRTPQQGASATSGLTFAGQRARSNNITVDGLDNNDAAVGSVRATFSQDAVAEFQVLTHSFPAEFGKASGGVVNIVTRSGTNRTAGSAFLFIRDDVLNAKEHFEQFAPDGRPVAREKAPYGQQQFGGTLGGPLVRDRSFYFLSFERLDIAAHNLVTIDDRTVVTLGPALLGTPKQILERAGFPVDTGSVPYAVRTHALLGKVDHHLSNRHSAGVRFNYADALNENIEPWGGLIARSRGAALDSRDNMVAAWHTLAASRMVNEARFQYARRDQNVNALDPACGGPCLRDDQGGPTLDVTGFASVGRQRTTPQTRHSRRWQLVDTLTYQRASHQVKAGLDTSVIRNVDETVPLHFGGRFVFAAAVPGALFGLAFPVIDAIQAVALGLPSAYVQGYGNPRTSYAVSDLSVFVQDDWRVTPRLTLKLGVRYQDQFWPETQYQAPGVAPYRFPRDRNNLAPRLALAWDPTGSRRTSVHAAYGIYFDNQITGLAGVANILGRGASGVRTLAAQLPSPLPAVAWNAPGRRLPESAVGAFPSTAVVIDSHLRTPYAHHWSAGVERELPRQLALRASLLYSRGQALPATVDYNPIVPALGPGRRPDDVAGRPGTSTSVLQYTSFGETWYRGMVIEVGRRFDDRYQILASYTLSRSEDTATDFQSAFIPQSNGRGRDSGDQGGLPIGFDPRTERGPSVQDQRHRFVMSGVYVAPAAVQLSAILTAGSGRPYTILAGADLNGDGNGSQAPPDRARTNPADESTAASRNSATLPGQMTVDVRLSRRIGLGGPVYVEAIAEVFNLFNRTNYTDVNNIFGSGAYPTTPLPAFGQFTRAAPARQGQLAVRIGF